MLPIVTQQHNYHYLEHVTCVIYTGIRCSVAPLSHQLHVVFFQRRPRRKHFLVLMYAGMVTLNA